MDTAPAGVQSTGNDRRSIERRRLTVYIHRLSIHTPRATKKKWNRHEDTLLGIAHGAYPGDVLGELAEAVMSGHYMPKAISSLWIDDQGNEDLTSCRPPVDNRYRNGVMRVMQYMWAEVVPSLITIGWGSRGTRGDVTRIIGVTRIMSF